ncbi:hypothetical protein A3H85_03285 [Candidatus Daviesbacteria bacterium RIFCSPLOWO2_02_FULL_40_8]|uniref:ZIP zinc transporter n=1 Tax=Candidatus Daviesbacteria bacterium RIFCSPLOWO2_01_FULL_40_24 TaxID=1797787 RepID=A0A1F5MIS3_9BACT|nr:MAG: hypothetical protein A2780_03055 [Candidatus Daviesbacteria bacterium RIFCSPHIGHO2_01_FULL_41_45]OGE34107.1 MAG: hypothetical protein A3C32_00235 [Candidatus Daviesbacteria bacterium RIFCSPHIGHO2_02_FULL_41_14]OGE65263.1 MAG: hypothetical protein A3B49_02430 [Candidatus Daviesbacteria bacterium RIFCSPLOWO2_01_FULL_40_24]OGE66534.1 MAG: hypothetical protein A3H85_03285 [Candidatus Daviesbacteria bacterium RIFCSPLOWO2_02_FULL_40_8]
MSILGSIVVANLLIGMLALVGVFLLLKKEFINKHTITFLVSFAAGVILATSFLDLLPEAIEGVGEPQQVLPFTLLAIVSFFFLERFVLWFHHHDDTHGANPASVLILLGDSLHNFIDGVAIAAAFLTDPNLGILTTVAIAAHEIPQEFADFSILVSGGMKKTKALLFNFLSGLTAILGGVVGFFFLDKISTLLPITLAFTAGMFIYIACSDLIPDLHRHLEERKGWIQFLPFLFGIGLTWIMVVNLGH